MKASRRQAAAIRSALRGLDEGENQLRAFELERKALEETLVTNAERSLAARTSEALDRSRVANVVVLSPPTTAPDPSIPGRRCS